MALQASSTGTTTEEPLQEQALPSSDSTAIAPVHGLNVNAAEYIPSSATIPVPALSATCESHGALTSPTQCCARKTPADSGEERSSSPGTPTRTSTTAPPGTPDKVRNEHVAHPPPAQWVASPMLERAPETVIVNKRDVERDAQADTRMQTTGAEALSPAVRAQLAAIRGQVVPSSPTTSLGRSTEHG